MIMANENIMIMRTILSGINWENLSKETPPRLLPYLPATCADGPEFWGDSEVTKGIEQNSNSE
jgi:hypothetical protein